MYTCIPYKSGDVFMYVHFYDHIFVRIVYFMHVYVSYIAYVYTFNLLDMCAHFCELGTGEYDEWKCITLYILHSLM